MIVLDKVQKQFGKLTALNKVSANFHEGECVALVGPNGSGKTTMMKCLLGMVLPDSGSICYKDADISGQWAFRKELGYMPQIGRYPDNMTIGHVIDMIRDLRKDVKIPDLELYDAFGLGSLTTKRMRTLSGGTRQKVSACLAFMFNPNVLILDEPTAGLDPVTADSLKEKIHKAKAEGKLILISSHVLSELDDLASHVIYLHEGNVRFHLEVKELQQITGEGKLAKAVATYMRDNPVIG